MQSKIPTSHFNPAGPRERKIKLGFSASSPAAADAIENSMKLLSLPYSPAAGRRLLANDTATIIVDSALKSALTSSKATKAELTDFSRDGLAFSLGIKLSGYPDGLSAAELDADASTAATDSSEGLKKTIDEYKSLKALIDSSSISAEVDTSPKVAAPPTTYANDRDIFIKIKPTDVVAMEEGLVAGLLGTASNGITALETVVAGLSKNGTDVDFVSYERAAGSDVISIIVRMGFSNMTDDEMNQEGNTFISDIYTAMAVQSSRKLFASKVLEDAGGSLTGASYEGAGAYAPESFVEAAGAGAVRVIASTLFMAAASLLFFA